MDKEINEKIIKYSEEVREKVIDHRRMIHRFAETGGKEFKTHDYITGVLNELHIPYEEFGETGVIATLDTGREGPGICLRADMDALPVKEAPVNLKGKRTCISENENTCHACGHDAHTAMLLGSIEVLAGLKDLLNGILYFVFEPGEEIGYGIQAVITELGKRKIDTLWGIHVYAPFEAGKISVSAGPRMAGGSPINLTIHGRGGHGSRPDLTANPVFVAAKIATELPAAIMYETDAEKTITCAITSINGGNNGNVIPGECSIMGTMRWFDVEEGKKAVEKVKSIIEHAAALYGCTVEYKKGHGRIGIPVLNDRKCAEIAEKGISEIVPAGTVTESGRWFASESMSMYLNRYPGVFAFLGINNPEKGSGAPHHNEYFDIDEAVLVLGVKASVKYVFSYLASRQRV